MPSFHKILVPVDFSSHSTRALDTAIELALLFGARLRIAHVEQPIMPAPVPYMPPLTGLEAAAEAVRTACEKQLLDAAGRARAAGVRTVDIELLDGIAWREIVELAKRETHDLIVMGTHGRSGFQRALLGSVAERVVRKAPCAVLTVRHAEEAGDAEQPQARTGS
jgi:nucleotide-binding universal stress UspA family protein